MKVYRGYMRIVARNIGLLCMYIGIAVGIALISQAGMEEQASGGFAALRQPVAVIDREGGLLGKALTGYVEQEQKLVRVKDEEQAIQDELFYRNVSCVIIVPEGAEEAFREGRAALEIIQVPGSAAEYYMDARINSFLNQIRVYCAGGFSMEEACERALALAQSEPSVTLLDVNGNKGERPAYNLFFQCLPYGLMGGLIMCLSTVILEFKKKEIERRVHCSPVPLWVQNLAAIGCFLTVGSAVWAVCMAVQAIQYAGGIFTSSNAVYYILNSLVCMATAMSLACLAGMMAKHAGTLNGISNVITLGLCFLGGVFVPIEMLNGGTKKVSVFLPTYWYSKINGILGDFAQLDPELLRTVWQGLFIQILFSAACFGVTMAVVRARVRE